MILMPETWLFINSGDASQMAAEANQFKVVRAALPQAIGLGFKGFRF